MPKLPKPGLKIIFPKKFMDSPLNQNQIQKGIILNAYPDSLGGSISYLTRLLAEKNFSGVFQSLYLLPTVFHSDLDRGFSIIDYHLNESFVTEEDLRQLKSLGIGLKLDIVLNHLSVGAPEFKDLIKHGDHSPYLDFFIDWNRFWEGYGTLNAQGVVIPKAEFKEKLFTRKPGLPILQVPFPDNSFRPYWNTFYQKITLAVPFIEDCRLELNLDQEQSKALFKTIENELIQGNNPSQAIESLGHNVLEVVPIIRRHLHLLGQMDLNAESASVWKYYEDTLKKLRDYGGQIIRLDAFAYLHKAVGESNFFNVPETWQYLNRLQKMAQDLSLAVLPEIHAQYGKHLHDQVSAQGFPIYDFFLPGLIIHTIENRDKAPLIKWAQEILEKGFRLINMLGCHDGIPLLDLDGDPEHPASGDGLLSTNQIEALIEKIVARGGRIKNLFGPDGEKIAYYQVNATYFSALGEDTDKMLLARALQLFMPGTPQIWYLDLFGGTNDYVAADTDQGNHKEINRTNLTHDQIQERINSSLVLNQLELIRLRGHHPAFNGQLEIIDTDVDLIELRWTLAEDWAQLSVDLRQKSFSVTHS